MKRIKKRSFKKKLNKELSKRFFDKDLRFFFKFKKRD